MKAVFDGTAVQCGKEGFSLYDQGGFGRKVAGGLRLAPHEALYLLHRGKIEIPGQDFDSMLAFFARQPDVLRSYLVYRDLRGRGYAVQTGPHDFRVFKRGQRPGTGESVYLVRVVSERDPILFSGLIHEATTARNLRKSYVLSVVDDEDELTYYGVKLPKPEVLPKESSYPAISGITAGKSVLVKIPPGSPFTDAWLGSRLDDFRTLFSPLETHFLVREGVLEVTDRGTALPSEEVLARAAEGDSEFAAKAAVYSDLRNLGYVPKTGYKFGHHFRVYSKERVHSEMLVHAVGQDTELPMSTVSRSVRLANSVKKKMLFGTVHSNGIQYVEFTRIKL